jgi:hypothetical protein
VRVPSQFGSRAACSSEPPRLIAGRSRPLPQAAPSTSGPRPAELDPRAASSIQSGAPLSTAESLASQRRTSTSPRVTSRPRLDLVQDWFGRANSTAAPLCASEFVFSHCCVCSIMNCDRCGTPQDSATHSVCFILLRLLHMLLRVSKIIPVLQTELICLGHSSLDDHDSHFYVCMESRVSNMLQHVSHLLYRMARLFRQVASRMTILCCLTMIWSSEGSHAGTCLHTYTLSSCAV